LGKSARNRQTLPARVRPKNKREARAVVPPGSFTNKSRASEIVREQCPNVNVHQLVISYHSFSSFEIRRQNLLKVPLIN
jgi:hypothetical protein